MTGSKLGWLLDMKPCIQSILCLHELPPTCMTKTTLRISTLNLFIGAYVLLYGWLRSFFLRWTCMNIKDVLEIYLLLNGLVGIVHNILRCKFTWPITFVCFDGLYLFVHYACLHSLGWIYSYQCVGSFMKCCTLRL